MILPCRNEERVTKQVKPAVNLLTNLDEIHPEILLEHDIQPDDYKKGLVFRSAVEHIRGKYIASQVTDREGLVGNVLDNLLNQKLIVDYKKTSGTYRHDFELIVERNPDFFAALEIKGGEGNSINISERPLWAKEFGVWCHLDGAIVNEPSHGVHSILNRVTNELVRRKKLVDVLFIKDILCGTVTRPCPKYPKKENKISLEAAPDIFLLPSQVPTPDEPLPPTHSLETLRVPNIILDLFNISGDDKFNHIWEVQVELVKLANRRLKRIVKVWHKGEIVGESTSRSWLP